MRTTVRIDDDLFRELKDRAHKEGISLAKLFDRIVRLGFQTLKKGEDTRPKPYREKAFSTGVPLIDVTKARQVLDELDDEERIRKMRLGQ